MNTNTNFAQWIRFETALANLEEMLGSRTMRHLIQAYILDRAMHLPSTITPKGDVVEVEMAGEKLAVEAGYLNLEMQGHFGVHGGPFERPEDKALIQHVWQTAFRLFDELEVAKPETREILVEAHRRLMYQAPPEANQSSFEEYFEYFLRKVEEFRPLVSRQWLYELAVERAGWKDAKVTVHPERESVKVVEHFGFSMGPFEIWGNKWHTDGKLQWRTIIDAKVGNRMTASFSGQLSEASWALKKVNFPQNVWDQDFKGGDTQMDIFVWDDMSPLRLYEVLRDLNTSRGYLLPDPLKDRAVAHAFVAEYLKPVPTNNGQALQTAHGLLRLDAGLESSGPLTWLRDEHGESLFAAHYGQANKDFLRGLKSVKVAAGITRKTFQLVRLTRGADWEAVKLVPHGEDHFPLKGHTVTWGENGYNLEYQHPWLAAFFKKHGNALVRRLIDGAKWEVLLENSWPEELEYNYSKGQWKVQGWPIAIEEDKYVQVRLDQIRPHWTYLGAEPGPWENSHSRNSHGKTFLTVGAQAHAAHGIVLLPLKAGETKDFVITCRYDWCGKDCTAVFGFTANRTAEGLTFTGYDPGERYSCFGRWGEEIVAVEIED